MKSALNRNVHCNPLMEGGGQGTTTNPAHHLESLVLHFIKQGNLGQTIHNQIQVQFLFVLKEKAIGSVGSVTWPRPVENNGEKCTISKAHFPQSEDRCGIDVGYASACASLVAHIANISTMAHVMTRAS